VLRAEGRRRLEQFEGRVEFVLADLAKPLPIDPVDAILSTATFHWVHDHNALVANLASVLRSGGQPEAQCGGAGNMSSAQAVLRALGHRTDDGVYFTKPDEMTHRAADGRVRAGPRLARTLPGASRRWPSW
jgi:trans-aconitate 2-methyltransferase